MARPDRAALEERARRLRELLEAEPEDATSWYALGRALAGLRRAGEAADAFREALRRKPDYAAAYRELGRALLAEDEAEEARSVLGRGIEVAERTGDLQTVREMEVFLRRAGGAPREEAGGAPEARAAEPAEAHAAPVDEERAARARRACKGAFDHFAQGRPEEAAAGYREAVELDPGLAIAWNGLAMAEAQRGDLDAALEAGRRAVALEPDEPLGHTSLSIFYQRKGRIAEAEEEKALASRLQRRGRGGG